MDVRGAPRVLVVAPWVSARFDGDEPISTLAVGQATAGACEVRVERRGMIVHRVYVSPGRVALPHLDQRVTHCTPVAVDDAAADGDSLPKRLPFVLLRQVSVSWKHRHT